MITIASMRGGNWPSHPWQQRVDRASVLGNPFALGRTCTRDESCDKYAMHFQSLTALGIGGDNEFCEELRRLLDIHHKYGRLELMCWCAPLRCHSETIQEYLQRRI